MIEIAHVCRNLKYAANEPQPNVDFLRWFQAKYFLGVEKEDNGHIYGAVS